MRGPLFRKDDFAIVDFASAATGKSLHFIRHFATRENKRRLVYAMLALDTRTRSVSEVEAVKVTEIALPPKSYGGAHAPLVG